MRDPQLASLIGGASRLALVSIVDLCLEESVDALVIAGDLYDGEQTSMKTARFLADQFTRLHEAGIHVYKVRGNHDALSKISRELIPPPSLKLFGGRAEFIEVRRGALDVAIHGLSFSKPYAPDSLLPKYEKPRPGAVNIGIMHTSLGGAAGHDPYAPCSVADLHDSGFDYWALGHIHVRSEHRGASSIVMPGMPQGRDIGEAGPKSVSLVTILDDRTVVIEQRSTSIAQFERVAVDVSKAQSWPEVVDNIETELARVRAKTPADHLVARLVLEGSTPVGWRLRRDRDLLQVEVGRRLDGGRIWIDKVEINTTSPRAAAPRVGAPDPLDELGLLIQTEVRRQHGVRESVRHLVKEVRDDLPAEARRFGGEDEVAFEAFIDDLLDASGEEIIARLTQEATPR